jgi:hypothetical protein
MFLVPVMSVWYERLQRVETGFTLDLKADFIDATEHTHRDTQSNSTHSSQSEHHFITQIVFLPFSFAAITTARFKGKSSSNTFNIRSSAYV